MPDLHVAAAGSLLDDLLTTLRSDFAKYRKRVPANRLNSVFDSLAAQAGGKFMYSRVDEDLRAEQVHRAAELLRLAGPAYRIPHSSAQGIPLGAQVNPRRFKMLPCDVGLYQRLRGLRLPDEISKDDRAVINTGATAEIVAGTGCCSSEGQGRDAGRDAEPADLSRIPSVFTLWNTNQSRAFL